MAPKPRSNIHTALPLSPLEQATHYCFSPLCLQGVSAAPLSHLCVVLGWRGDRVGRLLLRARRVASVACLALAPPPSISFEVARAGGVPKSKPGRTHKPNDTTQFIPTHDIFMQASVRQGWPRGCKEKATASLSASFLAAFPCLLPSKQTTTPTPCISHPPHTPHLRHQHTQYAEAMLAWNRRLLWKSSAASSPSFHPPSSTAQQQVLLVDGDLLREVLFFLGTDVAECRAALLVSHFWGAALER